MDFQVNKAISPQVAAQFGAGVQGSSNSNRSNNSNIQNHSAKQKSQNQLVYTNNNANSSSSSTTGINNHHNNIKASMYSTPQYQPQYNSLKNSFNGSTSNPFNQKQQFVQGLASDQMVYKKMEGRTNSQHQLQQHSNSNQTFSSPNGPMFSNILQNIDNSKSTDTSPQMRSANHSSNYNCNSGNSTNNKNPVMASLNLTKGYSHQQLSSSKSFAQPSSTSTINNNNNNNNINNTSTGAQNPIYQLNSNSYQQQHGSQTQKHNKSNSQTPNQFSQHLSYISNVYPFSNYQKESYLQQQQNSYSGAQPFSQTSSLSIQKPLQNNFISTTSNQLQPQQQQQQQTVYLSPTKKVSHNLMNNIANSKLISSISKSYQEINKSNSNSKIFIDPKQQSREETPSLPSNSQQTPLLKEDETVNGKFMKIQYPANIDIYSQSHYLTKNQNGSGENGSNPNENQLTSSNATEEEGAKLYTLESGSLQSQQQHLSPQIAYKQALSYEKEARILQLEKENKELKEKVANLEIQLQNINQMLETKFELEKYKLKEVYETQNQEMKAKFEKESDSKKQVFQQQLQSQNTEQKSILIALQSMMSQHTELSKQYKWIQDKLCEQDIKSEDKQQNSDIIRSDQFQVSLDNIVQIRAQNKEANSIIKKQYTNNNSYSIGMSNNTGNTYEHHQIHQGGPIGKVEAEIINEEDDCSTGTHQELVKKSKLRNDYQQSKEYSCSTNEENMMLNSNGFQQNKDNMNEKSFNDDLTLSSPSPYPKKKLSNRNGSVLLTTEGRIEELEKIIGAKNHEIQDLKEKLYEAKDYFMQQIPNTHKLNIPPALTFQETYPQKRRKSYSSSSDLHSLASLTNMRKQIQNSIMEWSYCFDLSGSVERLIEEGWRIQELHNKVNLNELNQVIGVVGMPKTGKTTVINGLMKGNLQTVEELKKSTFFEPMLNIVLDENIAIFEYSYMQPIQIDNKGGISMSSIADLSQQKQFSTLLEEQVTKTNKRDFFWIDFFIKHTQTLIVVFDKFTQEEQKMLSEILYRIENEEDLVTKELILIHNYYSKGLKSAQELQLYFGQSLQHIDANFKQKPMVELKMYKTVLIQKNTKSKKCTHITHILNGNLFEPFADKYQHNMLQYCMDRLSATGQTNKKFIPQFENFLQKNIGYYLIQSNVIPSFQQIETNRAFLDYQLQFDPESSSLSFKQTQ